MRRLPSDEIHWNIARRVILIAPVHWAALRVTSTLDPNTQPMHDISDLQESFNLYSQISRAQTIHLADLEYSWIQVAEGCEHSTTVLPYQVYLGVSVHHLATLSSCLSTLHYSNNSRPRQRQCVFSLYSLWQSCQFSRGSRTRSWCPLEPVIPFASSP